MRWRAYLQALAAGDAVAALSYAADPAPTGPLLTNEVLVESGERAALTEIEVPVVEDQDATSVSATYTLGDAAVTESFDVVKVADSWKLSRAVKDLDISFIVGGSVPVKINGVTVDQDSVAVLPGSYAFTHRAALRRLRIQERCAGEESLRRGRHVQHPKPAEQIGQEGRHLGRQEALQQVPRGQFAHAKELPDQVRLASTATTRARSPGGRSGVIPSGKPRSP